MKTILKMMATAAAAALCLLSCDRHTPYRPTDTSGTHQGGGGNNPGGGGNNPGGNTTVKAKLMSNWVIEYKGREQYTEDNGTVSDVERFHVEAPGAAYYLVRTINPEVLQNNYGTDLAKFFQDEQSYLEQDAQAYNKNVTDDLYNVSPQDLLFDRIRHGEWEGYVIGFDTKGKVTGEYAKCTFTIQEEEATSDFTKWLGDWTISDGNVSYHITVSSSEANLAYFIDGWETGSSIDNDTGTVMDGTEDYFETFFKPSNGAMYFTSQYIQTYEEEGKTYNQFFLGNIYYNGRLVEKGEYVIPEEGLNLAAAQMTDLSGERAEINGCAINAYMTDDDNSLYETAFISMQYFADDGKNLLKFNLNVPQFPLTMVKTSSGTTARPAIARRAVTKQALKHSRLQDVRKRPSHKVMARKAAN